MIRLALSLWLLMACYLSAAPVLVKSGEHDGFTRLVLEFGAPVQWQVGRGDDGYSLHIEGKPPVFDLADAFRLIGKGRLAALWVDAKTGNLQIGVACNCHVIPFEFRPGILVIDLRDGGPPKDSSFEAPLAEPVGSAKPKAKHDAGGFEWTDAVLDRFHQEESPTAVLQNLDPGLGTLREALLHQLSRGASEGVIDFADARNSVALKPVLNSFASVRVGLGELPGVAAAVGLPDHSGIAAKGEACIAAKTLDLASWGNDEPVFLQMAQVKQGMLGEFDKVESAAVQRAIRFDLFIGFGAEARQLLQTFPSNWPEKNVLQSLAYLLDDEPDPTSVFIGQASCDTPASLWAILADPSLTKGSLVNVDSAYLAFSALPVELRRHLGPRLAERFLAMEDATSARKIQDAILRSPGTAGSDVTLMEAKLDLANHDNPAAEARLRTLVQEAGPGTSEALIALVEVQVSQNHPIGLETVIALEAIVQEQTGSSNENAARRALLLAQAASGDFESAFATLAAIPDAETVVWRLLANIGQDDVLLRHAIRASETAQPDVSDATASQIAARLMGLGFSQDALMWLKRAPSADATLIARNQLQRHDAGAVLAALAENDEPEALGLRALALHQIGDDLGAAQVYAAAGDTAAELRALAVAKRWTEISQRGPEPWQSVALKLEPTSFEGLATDVGLVGPLARDARILETSLNTRAAIEALLDSVAAP